MRSNQPPVFVFSVKFRGGRVNLRSKLGITPGSTSDSSGCIRGPTPPPGGVKGRPYLEGCYWCCCQGNFLGSILFLSFWAAKYKRRTDQLRCLEIHIGEQLQDHCATNTKAGGITESSLIGLYNVESHGIWHISNE